MRRIGVAFVVAMVAVAVVPDRARADVYVNADVSFGLFHETLSPYGQWVAVAGLGPVWRPYDWAVGPGFRPYATGGRWVLTEAGWAWDTDWEWGWAPFHYGRWYLDAAYGWVWVPGYEWAPAWVDWRFGGGYVGWAPLPPAGITVSFGIGGWGPHWCFVESGHFAGGHVHSWIVPPHRVRDVYVVTERVHRRPHGRWAHGGWHAGPPPERVAPRGHARPVPVRPVEARPVPAWPSARPIPADRDRHDGFDRADRPGPGRREPGFGRVAESPRPAPVFERRESARPAPVFERRESARPAPVFERRESARPAPVFERPGAPAASSRPDFGYRAPSPRPAAPQAAPMRRLDRPVARPESVARPVPAHPGRGGAHRR